jgi:glyoxylase-like metal-dependent hydrolase (beta-lactamase superfamily II)
VNVVARLRGFGREQYVSLFRGSDTDANVVTRLVSQICRLSHCPITPCSRLTRAWHDLPYFPFPSCMEPAMATMKPPPTSTEHHLAGANRRVFLQGSVAAFVGSAGLLGQPRTAGAAVPFAGTQAPGFYRLKIGQFEVTALSDGFFELPADSFATNAPPEERRKYFETRLLPADKLRLQASPLLINTGEKLVLVDSGVGPGSAWAPGAGRLYDTLKKVGIDAPAIDVVVITHAHPDHIGGLVDSTGTLRFPNAEFVLSDVELDLWTAPDAKNRLPEWAAQFLDPTKSVFTALGDHVRPIKGDADIVTGVKGVHTPGHTQGHLALLIGSGSDQLFVTGDAIANIHIAFERPDWQIIWDHDREQGAKTRARLLDQMATDRLLVAGYHYPFPGFGHVVRSGNAYHWLPADWNWTF